MYIFKLYIHILIDVIFLNKITCKFATKQNLGRRDRISYPDPELHEYTTATFWKLSQPSLPTSWLTSWARFLKMGLGKY